MTGMNRLSSILSTIAMLGVGGALVGCGGISPGDYKIYEVTLSKTPRLSAGCPQDPNERTSDNGLEVDSWYITAGASDSYFLDTGKDGYAGAKTDSTYDFNETLSDVKLLATGAIQVTIK